MVANILTLVTIINLLFFQLQVAENEDAGDVIGKGRTC